MAIEDLEKQFRAMAIAKELNEALRDGSFGELQQLLTDLGFYIQLRKPKENVRRYS